MIDEILDYITTEVITFEYSTDGDLLTQTTVTSSEKKPDPIPHGGPSIKWDVPNFIQSANKTANPARTKVPTVPTRMVNMDDYKAKHSASNRPIK